ncbi:hypothetical protein [Winogradskyella ludwigii]|uniref:hypothetical protein n=1 Tax=Winogradskyella ludwigii TaxID=2686076 RepID=UPI0015C6C5A2|nr:hypothetical protein [Winogradskyella ludwigii]
MLKKANILFLVAIVILFSIRSIRCGSVTKNDTETSRDSQKVSWQVFYNNAQIAIKEREFQIEELRKEILTDRKKEEQKRITTLDSLEQKKNSLKTRLAHFNTKLKATLGSINESDKVLKTTFENAFVKDMNELLAGLRDFWKTSK